MKKRAFRGSLFLSQCHGVTDTLIAGSRLVLGCDVELFLWFRYFDCGGVTDTLIAEPRLVLECDAELFLWFRALSHSLSDLKFTIKDTMFSDSIQYCAVRLNAVFAESSFNTLATALNFLYNTQFKFQTIITLCSFDDS